MDPFITDGSEVDLDVLQFRERCVASNVWVEVIATLLIENANFTLCRIEDVKNATPQGHFAFSEENIEALALLRVDEFEIAEIGWVIDNLILATTLVPIIDISRLRSQTQKVDNLLLQFLATVALIIKCTAINSASHVF